MNLHQKKLAVVKSFVVRGHTFARIVKTLSDAGHVRLTKTDHLSYHKLAWDNPKAISTYEDCVELRIERDKRGTETLKLYIWEGEILRGHRTNLRSVYWFEGAWWKNISILKALEHEFKFVCELELNREAEKEHERRVEIMGQKLLDRLSFVPLLPAPEETVS